MKLKSLLYSTAAVLVGTGASTGAMAADLPVAAEPVEYVRVCDAFGKGFFYIPGTDTCLRVSGRVRIRAFVRDDDDSDKDTDHFTSYARAYANFDARNETDFGLLRSYFSFRHTFGDRGVSTSNYDTGYGTALVVDEAFISLSNDMGQWTVGKTSSFFDFFGGYTLTGNGGFDQTTDAILFGYTFNVGNGVSFSLAAEDPYGSGRKSVSGDGDIYGDPAVGFPPIVATTDDETDGSIYGFGAIYGGQEIPDIVANLRADQGWGSVQIMGALRQINVKQSIAVDVTTNTTMIVTTGGTTTITTTSTADVPVSFIDEEWGWAVGLGLEIDVPGMPVSFATQGGYSEGACAYVAAAPERLVDAIAVGDGTAGNGRLELTECWQVGAGVSIAAGGDVSIDIDGAYGDIDHFGSLFDYDYWGAAAAVTWKGIKGLAIAGEIQYSEIDPDVNSAGETEITDDDSWQFTLSFQRDF